MEVGGTSWVGESTQKSMTPNILNIRVCYRKNKIKSIQESKTGKFSLRNRKQVRGIETDGQLAVLDEILREKDLERLSLMTKRTFYFLN